MFQTILHSKHHRGQCWKVVRKVPWFWMSTVVANVGAERNRGIKRVRDVDDLSTFCFFFLFFFENNLRILVEIRGFC